MLPDSSFYAAETSMSSARFSFGERQQFWLAHFYRNNHSLIGILD